MSGLPGQAADEAPTARPNAAALTSDRLGEAWPVVSARLRRMLATRGVDPVLNDDIVQEVAVRALANRVPFVDPDDLYRWAATTARRVHIDHVRSGCRLTSDEDLSTVPDATDVAHAAERRVALDHVWRALARMRPGERDAILDSLEDREARTSLALVRRHRARASLRKAVGGVLTTVTLARLRLREFAPAMRAAGTTATIAPMIAVGTAGWVSVPETAPREGPRAVVTSGARREPAPARGSVLRAPARATTAGVPRVSPAPADVRPTPRADGVAPPREPSIVVKPVDDGPEAEITRVPDDGTVLVCVDERLCVPKPRPI